MNTLPAETANEYPTLRHIKDDTPDTDSGRDSAGKQAFSLTRLERMVADCDNQPNWRPRADLCHAFVDGKQFTPQQEAALIAEGLTDVRPTNLVGRVIRSVCGTEAKARTDIKVESDDDDTSDVCEVLNQDMKESQRETYADMAVSAAYFGQTVGGVGWVEVGECSDPLDYPDRVVEVHRSEMWWDWKATDTISRDGRFQLRKRWADLDELEARMPQHKALFRNVSNGWAGFLFDDSMDEESTRRSLGSSYNDESRWSNYRRRMDWYDSTRKRVKLYEVWYKCPAIGVILHFAPNKKLLFDPTSQLHIQAVSSGQVKVTKELTTQVRVSLFAGPHRLSDRGTTRRNFPYVPFFAYRDDEDLSPYGLVEGMISPQMEYNARRIRINWMLRARQMVLDNDALDTKANTLANIADQVMRPDLTVVLDANRKNKDAFKIGTDMQLQKEQVDVMQDAKQLIQDVPGVYGSQLGQAQSGVTSGIANSLLIEQGAVAMGDLNDNYRHSRRMVFELLLENVTKRRLEADMRAKIGRGSARRVVILNHWQSPQEEAAKLVNEQQIPPEQAMSMVDPQGKIINNVADAKTRIGLGEVPNSPSFRMQQQQTTATIIQALAQASPQAAAVMAPSYIESTDLPDRMERADDVRRALGVPTAGDKQAEQKMQEQRAQQQAQEQQAQQAAIQLGMEKEAALINEIKSKTELNTAKSFQIGHSVGLGQAQAQMQPAEQPDPEAEKNRLIEESMAEAMA